MAGQVARHRIDIPADAHYPHTIWVYRYGDGKVKVQVKGGGPMLLKQLYQMGHDLDVVVELVKPGD